MVNFEGPREKIDQVPTTYGVDEAYHLEDFNEIIQKMYVDPATKGENRKLHFYLGATTPINFRNFSKYINPFLNDLKSNSKSSPNTEIHTVDKTIDKFRAIKSSNEQNLLISAAEISSNAINLVRTQIGNLENESQILAALRFAAANVAGPGVNLSDAYPPVVASGKNTTTLLYEKNNQFFNPENDHFVVDFGVCQYNYNSDVTRSFAAASASSKSKNLEAVRQVYDSLYKINLQLIEAVKLAFAPKAGAREKMSLADLNKLYQILLIRELASLGFSKKAEDLIDLVSQVCPHDVCHYIGLDIHDCKSFTKETQLKPGMCFSLEPGVYLYENNPMVPEKFKNIGLRIEDIIVITDSGEVVVASGSCEKSPDVVFG